MKELIEVCDLHRTAAFWVGGFCLAALLIVLHSIPGIILACRGIRTDDGELEIGVKGDGDRLNKKKLAALQDQAASLRAKIDEQTPGPVKGEAEREP